MKSTGSKKRILLVSRSFYPEHSPRSLRATALVKEFASRGHEVTLLTVKNGEAHVRFEKKYNVVIKDFGPLYFPSIDIQSSSSLWWYLKRAIRRGMQLFFEYPDIELMYRVANALQKESGYDLLVSIAVPYPVHWGVAWAWRKKNPIAKTWVADCGDPYYGLENDSFDKFFYFGWIEKWFCRKADVITIPFEGGRSAYFKEFQEKIRIIPQGLTFPKELNTNHTKNEVITFAYFGNIQSYLHYAVPFLEKLNSIEKDFRFVIYTKRKELFRDKLDQQTLSKCELHGYIDREVLLNRLSSVDFLVHFPYQKESQKSLKLVDYNFLAKPILEYKNDEFSDRVFGEFLEYNFENRREPEDYRKHEIGNICSRFLALMKDKKQLIASC